MKKKILITLTFLLFILCNIRAQTLTQIPDDNFEQSLIDLGYDDILDDYVITENISEITSLDISSKNIAMLTGIADFINLEILNCSDNKLTEINISANTKLVELNFGLNEIKAIDLTNNLDIEKLNAYFSVISELDVSKNVKLTELILIGIINSPLQKIDLSNNLDLKILDLFGNAINEINLTNNIALEEVRLSYNNIREIDLSKNIALKKLFIEENTLFSLDIVNNINIEWLYTALNPMTCIKVADVNTANQISNKNIGQAIFSLDCTNTTNQIYVPGDNFEQALIDLGYDDVLDDYVTIENIEQIKILPLNSKQIVNLTGIENFEALETLELAFNNLESIDVSNLKKLKILDLQYNSLSLLDVSKNVELENLGCRFNAILELDVSKNLKVKNLSVASNQINGIDVTNNVVLENLGINDNKINEIDLSKNTQLNTLWAGNNNLTQIDLSNNPKLVRLTLDNNSIDEIDFSNLINLSYVILNGNQLSEINLSNNIALQQIYLGSNNLTALDVSKNVLLNKLSTLNNSNLSCINVSDVPLAQSQSEWYLDEATSYSIDCSMTTTPEGKTFVPDDNFEQVLIDLGYDDVLDNYVVTATIAEIISLDISSKNILQLTGIEDFINLEIFDCSSNTITGANVSNMTKLKILDVQNNKLGLLDVSKNLVLEELNCQDNAILALDVSKNLNLKVLLASKIKIDAIDLTSNIALKTLDVYRNKINEIDLSKNTQLESLNATSNNLNKIDVSNNPNLVRLTLDFNSIDEIDLSNLKLLTYLVLDGNHQLSDIDLSNNLALEDLFLNSITLTSLDVSKNVQLKNLSVLTNPNLSCISVANVYFALSEWYKDESASFSTDCYATTEEKTYIPDDNFEQALIDLGYDDVLDDYVITANLSEIIQLDLNQTGVQNLTGLAAFLNLEWLMLDNRTSGLVPLDNINVTQNLNLEILLLPGNNLKEIDLSKNIKLRGLDLESNQVESIDLSNNQDLQSIVLFGNKIKDLDLSKNERLELYILSNNQLESLNLKNGNNKNFAESVELSGNPNLQCIQVDDAEFSINNQYWIKDETASFSEDCSVNPTPEDSDNDGISDDIDLCPNTLAGLAVDESGCPLSTLADLVLENIQISIGSDPCSNTPSGSISIKSLRTNPIDVYIKKMSENSIIFNGTLNQANPIALNYLEEDDYNIVVGVASIYPTNYTWRVSFQSDTNEVETTVAITNPDKTYRLGVSGSTSYTAMVNGTITLFEFDTKDQQEIEIPLAVGMNQIKVSGLIACETEDNGEDGKNEDKLYIFPTLSDGLITISNTKERQIHGITVTGLNGIQTNYIPILGNPKEMKIDMSGVAKGMYIVRIQQASGDPILKKILIQ